MKLSPRLSATVSALWAVAVGATTQIPHLPSWGQWVIIGVGIILAGVGINTAQTPLLDTTTTTSAPAAGSGPPYTDLSAVTELPPPPKTPLAPTEPPSTTRSLP
jgi:hypothetical protein